MIIFMFFLIHIAKLPSMEKFLYFRTSLVVQGLRLQAPDARGPGLASGQETSSYIPQLKILHASTKIKDPTPCK